MLLNYDRPTALRLTTIHNMPPVRCEFRHILVRNRVPIFGSHDYMNFRLALSISRDCAMFDAIDCKVEAETLRCSQTKGAGEEAMSNSRVYAEPHFTHERYYQVISSVVDLKP